MLEYDGKTKCAAEWAEYAGISLALLLYRLKKGMSVKDALTRKVHYATAKAT